MPHAPNPLLVKLQTLRDSESPTVMSYEDALEYGIDLSGSGLDDYQEWMVKFTPDANIEGGLRLSYIAPDQFEYLPGETADDLMIYDPSGNQWTREQYISMMAETGLGPAEVGAYAAPEGYTTEGLTLSGSTLPGAAVVPFWQPEVEQANVEDEFLRLLRSVFADEAAPGLAPSISYGPYGMIVAPQPLLNFAQQSDETALAAANMWMSEPYSEDFIQKIRAKGQTADTEALLKMLIDVPTSAAEIGQTEADFMANVFGNIGPGGIELVDEAGLPVGIRVEQNLTVWDNTGDMPRQIGMWDAENDTLIPLPFTVPEKPEDTRGFWSKLWGTFEAAVGDTVQQFKGAINWFAGQGDFDLSFMGTLPNPAETVLKPAAEFLVPEWQVQSLQGRGVEAGGLGWNLARAIPPMVPLIVAGIVTGGAAGAAIGTTTKFGQIASWIASSFAGGATMRIMESAIEAGGAYDQALTLGKSQDEAMRIANEVFTRNTRDLTWMDMTQFAVGFGMPKLLNAQMIQKLANKGLIRVAGFGANMVFEGTTEAFEEYYQEIIQRQAFGEDISTWAIAHNLSDDEIRMVTLIGGILGMGMGTAFYAVSSVLEKAPQNLPPSVKPVYEQARKEALTSGQTPTQANVTALEAAAAAAPQEVEAAVTQVANAVKMQNDLQQMEAPPAKAQALEQKARETVPEVGDITYNGQVRIIEEQQARVEAQRRAETPEGRAEAQLQQYAAAQEEGQAGVVGPATVAQVQSLVDESRKGQSVFRIEQMVRKTKMTEENVQGFAALQEALADWHALDKKGKGKERFRAEQEAAWGRVVEALNGLSAVAPAQSLTPTPISQKTTLETETPARPGETLGGQALTPQQPPAAPGPQVVGPPLATWEQQREAARQAGYELVEVSPLEAQTFIDDFLTAQQKNKRKGFMNLGAVADLTKVDVYLMFDGQVGFIIGPDGYFSRGFNNGVEGGGTEMVTLGIVEGGVWGDPYGKGIKESAGFLPDKLYPKFGFRKTEEHAFDAGLADPQWNREEDDDPSYCIVRYEGGTRDADVIRRRAEAAGAIVMADKPSGSRATVRVYRGLSQSARERLGAEAQVETGEGVRGVQRGEPEPVTETIPPAPTVAEEAALLLEEQQLWLDFLDQTGDVPISWDDITNPTIDRLWTLVGIDPKTLVAKIAEMRGQRITKEHPILARELQAALKELNKTQADLTAALKERYEMMLEEQKKTAAEKLAGIRQKFADYVDMSKRQLAETQWKAERKLSETERRAKARQQVLKQRWADKATFIAEIKNDLRVYVQEHLPLRERGKMVAAIDNVTTETELEHYLGRVERLAEIHGQKVMRKRIVRLFKRTRLKKLPAKKYGVRIHADVQERLEYLRQNMGRDPEEISAEMRALGEMYEQGHISWDELNRGMEDLELQGLQGKTALELEGVHAQLKEIIANGISKRQQEVDAILAKRKRQYVRDMAVLSGGRGFERTRPGMRKPEGPQGLFNRIINAPSDLLRGLATFEGTLDLLSQYHKGSKPYQSSLSVWAMRLVMRAQDAGSLGSRTFLKADVKAKQRIFGQKNARKMGQLEHHMDHDVVDLGEFTDGYGLTVKMEYTEAQIIQIYQALLDPSLEPTFRSTKTRLDALDNEVPAGMGWTDEMMQAIEDHVTAHPKLKEYAAWQMKYWKDNWERIDKVFSKVYGVHLPFNPHYSRITRDYQKIGQAPSTPMSLVQEWYREASERNPSLRMRTMNTIPLKFMGAFENFRNQNLEMEHFIAWAEPITELRSFFYDPDVMAAIEQLHAKNINQWMKNMLDDFARGRINREVLEGGIEKLRQRFAVAGLSRASVLVKQVTSLPAYALRVGLVDFFHYAGEYMLNPIGHWREMYSQSTYLQERYDQLGIERDISYFQEQVREHPESRVLGVANWMMKAIAFMDATVNSPGMWAAYKSELKRTGNQRLAIENITTVTEGTQSTSRLSSLTSFQRGGTFMRLMTQFQNNEAKYWQEAATNVRGLIRGRADKATVLKNMIILWAILPCLFQWMTDAFKVKKEHLIPTLVLGPLQNMLAIGELWEVMGDRWIGGALGEEHFFDWNLFPMESVTRDVQRVIDEMDDLFYDITMENVVDVVEQLGKSSGYLLGLPTPYIAQAIDALRVHRWPETLEQLIWSKWALYEGEKTPEEQRQEQAAKLRELVDAYERLGTVIPAERAPLPGEPEVPPERFTMNSLRQEFNRILSKADPSQITEKNGYSAIVVNYNEMSQALAQTLMMPNVAPYEINGDPDDGFTFENWIDVWEARLRIDDPKVLAEFDKTWQDAAIDGDFTWGNLTKRQADLLRQYHALEDSDEQKAFRLAHPEINTNPREQWLRSHVQENALLALWGKADLYSIEAYNALRGMATELDIPESALIKVPPENVAKPYFQYQDYKEQGLSALSAEMKMLRLQNPEFDEWAHENLGWVLASDQGWNPIVLQIDMQYREQDEAWANLPNTDYARTMYLLENPEYADARWTRTAYDYGFAEEWVDDYVAYRIAIDLQGIDRKAYLYGHMAFYREALKVLGWAPIDFAPSLPTQQPATATIPNIPGQQTFSVPEQEPAATGYYGSMW